MLRRWVTSTLPAPPNSPLYLFCSPHHSPRNFSPSSPKRDRRFSMARSHRIAVVGDIHGDWDLQEDAKALQFLQADLVLFTGDFANENVELVKSIANLMIPKAAILGNHDCWYTSQFSEKKKDSVQLQLACLGEQHVGYCHLDFPTLKLSIVGGRPFSHGGDQLFRKRLLSARYGVSDMVGSAKKIYEAALGIPDDHSIVFLAHNGPTGLGSQINDICGKDWVFGGGDHGDPDLAQALSDLKKSTRLSIPLVVFGHMHKELAYGNGLRKMIVVDTDNTVYLNGAIVPRVKHSIGELGTSSRSYGNNEVPFQADGPHATLRAFTLIEMSDGRLEKITECWVSVSGDKVALEEENVLFNSCTELSS